MGEVRACVYFSVIFLCIQISAAKPFFGDWLWCEFFCEDDDGSTTTASSEDYFDSYCDRCPTSRTTTAMPPAVPNPATPLPPGAFGPPGSPGFNQAPGMGPGPVNYFMLNPPQNGGGMAFNMVPDPNRNGWNFVWNPAGGPGNAGTPPPSTTPAPVAAPTTAAAAAAPAAAASTAAPEVTTAAPAAPGARK